MPLVKEVGTSRNARNGGICADLLALDFYADKSLLAFTKATEKLGYVDGFFYKKKFQGSLLFFSPIVLLIIRQDLWSLLEVKILAFFRG